MRASRTIPFLFYVVLFQACIERFIIPNDLKTGPESDFGAGDTTYPVSYTHLTLPTIYSV